MAFVIDAVGGVVLAAVAATLLAIQNVCVRLATDGGRVSDAVVVVMAVNVGLVVPLALVVHYPVSGLTWRSAGAFATAGILGLVFGRICLYAGIELIGASRTTPIVSASTLISAILAVWLFGESLTVPHVIGICCIVAGVAVLSWLTAADAPESALRDVWYSLTFPIAAAVFLGVEPILIRTGLDEGTPVLVGLAVMMGAAFVSYLGYRLGTGRPAPSLRQNPHARWYLGAGLTSTVGLCSYFAALALAPVVIVIPLVQTAPLAVIVISALFLPRRLERVTWPLVVAAIVVVVGAILVSLAG